jgi:dienelactone hydrolase
MKTILLIILVFTLLLIGYSITVTPSYKTLDITHAIDKAKATLKNNQEIVVFDSKNPFNFYDVFHRIDEISDQKVFGILTKPDNVNTHPLIIGVAGSDGWGEHHYGYLERYLGMGFAVFSLHSFKSRDVASTVGEQLSVTIPMVIYDAFMALNKLSDNNNIDTERAGITGWSLGGGVALFTAWTPIQEAISPIHKFASHLPFYPPCMIMPDILSFSNAPIHILAGEVDDWVPAAACEELVEAANIAGYKIDITVYPGASHSFDRDQDVEYLSYAYSFTDCRLNISEDGIVSIRSTGFPLSSPTMQKIGLAFCADKGTHWGGNRYARERSSAFAIEFMKKHLMD